jgi:hypothetical protein
VFLNRKDAEGAKTEEEKIWKKVATQLHGFSLRSLRLRG